MSPEYFETMRIPLLRGEGCAAVDDSLSRSTVVINRTMARVLAGENPVGRRIQLFGSQGPGSASRCGGDVRQIAPETPAREEYYVSYGSRAGSRCRS